MLTFIWTLYGKLPWTLSVPVHPICTGRSRVPAQYAGAPQRVYRLKFDSAA